MAGAGVGAGIGSLGGPGTAMVGGMLGQAGGEMLKTGESSVEVPTIDVQALIDERMGQQKGFFEGALDELYAILKLCAVCFGIVWVFPLLYSFHRKKRAQAHYDTLHALSKRVDRITK